MNDNFVSASRALAKFGIAATRIAALRIIDRLAPVDDLTEQQKEVARAAAVVVRHYEQDQVLSA